MFFHFNVKILLRIFAWIFKKCCSLKLHFHGSYYNYNLGVRIFLSFSSLIRFLSILPLFRGFNRFPASTKITFIFFEYCKNLFNRSPSSIAGHFHSHLNFTKFYCWLIWFQFQIDSLSFFFCISSNHAYW